MIEGVMMRSPNFYTVSVRDEKGRIKMKQEKFVSVTKKMRILAFPIVRGMVHLVESMIIGYRALNYSNEIFIGEDEKRKVECAALKKGFYFVLSLLYVIFSLGITLFMLKFLPLFIAEKAAEIWPIVKENYLLFNGIDGLTKITVFIGYILMISLLNDIRRVFQYHGAEHKSVWTYENGLALTVENAKKQTRFHPRCGTSFIFIVIILSILVYTFLPPMDTFYGKLLERVAALPLIAGLSYETLKFSAKHENNFLMRLFVMPGLLIQRLTTKEPDEKQLEIALHSLKESLAAEKLKVL